MGAEQSGLWLCTWVCLPRYNPVLSQDRVSQAHVCEKGGACGAEESAIHADEACRSAYAICFADAQVTGTETAREAFSYLVSGWLESNCFRCWDNSFFSRDNLIHARARPTSVLISLMFWICLKNRSDRKDVDPKNDLELETN